MSIVNNRQVLLDKKYKNKCQWKKNLYCWHTKKIRNKYLRQPTIDFDFCNISSSCDVVYKRRWLKLAVYEWIGPGYTSINSGKNAFDPIMKTHIYLCRCISKTDATNSL